MSSLHRRDLCVTPDDRLVEAGARVRAVATRVYVLALHSRADLLELLYSKYGLSETAIRCARIGYADPAATSSFFSRLLSEGFSEQEVLASGLFMCPSGKPYSVFSGRITIPYPDEGGDGVAYLIGRKTDSTPDEPWEKAKYRKAVVHSAKNAYSRACNVLWGLDALADHPERILIAEGISDAVVLRHELGYPVVSPVTTRMTQREVERLREAKPRSVVLVPDRDLPGVLGAVSTARQILAWEDGVDVRMAALPLCDDGAKADVAELHSRGMADEINDAITRAEPAVLTAAQIVPLPETITSETLKEENSAVFEAMASLEEADRELPLAALHDRTGVSVDELRALVPGRNRMGAIRPPSPGSRSSHYDLDDVDEMLRCIPADDRDVWLRVGMALQHELGDEGRPLWDRWSATCQEKFNEDDQDRAWESFGRRDGVTIGTVVHIARQHGWHGSHTPGHPLRFVSPDADEWPEPRPVTATLPPVEPIALELLPDRISPWVSDIADRMQCPPDFAAAAAIVALAAAVGRKVGIRPKRKDSWVVVPNLWGALIGRPGVMKSPPLDEALRPLRRLEADAAEVHRCAMEEFEATSLVYEERRGVAKKAIKNALARDAVDPQELAHEYVQGRPERPEPRRHVVNDTTVEKLGEILKANPAGVLLFRDELVGFLRQLDKPGWEPARAFYLEAWSGTNRFRTDRIGRGSIDIPSVCVSIMGGIQPSLLADYLHALRKGYGDDGLIQRFQIAVWPDVPHEWSNVDRWPDKGAKDAAFEVFERLSNLEPSGVGAEVDEYDGIPFVRFEDDAQDIFDSWRADLEHRIRDGTESDSFTSHIAKYRSLVPALALIGWLADDGHGKVDVVHLQRAISMTERLETHARRMYAATHLRLQDAVETLTRKILGGKLGAEFALREVYRPQWAGLRDAKAAREACGELADLGWIRMKATTANRQPGRPSELYEVNPEILAGRAP